MDGFSYFKMRSLACLVVVSKAYEDLLSFGCCIIFRGIFSSQNLPNAYQMPFHPPTPLTTADLLKKKKDNVHTPTEHR